MAKRESDPRFHGRRAGRKLRNGQKLLVTNLLPTLSISVPTATEDCAPQKFFDADHRAYWLEIGFGGGEHLADQAAANPDIGILGAEPFINGVVTLLRQIEQHDLRNVRILDNDVRPLLDRLPTGSLERIFILFPDPWPKSRHHGRRIINPQTAEIFHRLLSATGELRIATDHRGYLGWILRHMLNHGGWRWYADGPDDWRSRPTDWPPTRYERKAIASGDQPCFLRFVKHLESNLSRSSE